MHYSTFILTLYQPLLSTPLTLSIDDTRTHTHTLYRHAYDDMLCTQVQSKIVVGLLAAVEAERQGLTVDREVMRRLLRMLVALGLYHDHFEVPFLADRLVTSLHIHTPSYSSFT